MDSDSDTETLSIILPGLISELRNVLDQYPDDGQILKEMIQNAEDAGAKTVKILADLRDLNHDTELQVSEETRSCLKFLQGPALCVYNDAQFTPLDWKGIRMVHASVKEKVPLKVGRFGLGFKSVFHLTDRLLVLSGEFLLYMDPFEGEESCFSKKKLSKLKVKEKQCLLHALKGTFEVDEQMFANGTFNGTLFWFPLREKPNDLSPNVYDREKLDDLWKAFKEESPSVLLFLKSIESIELYRSNSVAGKDPDLQYSVHIAPSCIENVQSKRTAYIHSILAAGGELPERAAVCSLLVDIDMSEYETSPLSRQERWLVVNYHAGKEDASESLLNLCAKKECSLRPYVGVAAPLGGQQDFQSNLFCFLPLPLDTQSPTGLPVHINGFFALSQNRRHLKWPTADQRRNHAHMEPQLLWNCLLVEQLLPRAYAQLLYGLKEYQRLDSIHFYDLWPDLNKVKDKWEPLIAPLYQEITKAPVFYSSSNDGQWESLDQVTLCTLADNIVTEIRQAIEKVYVLCHDKLANIPNHVFQGLEKLGILTTGKSVTPQGLRQLLAKCQSGLQAKDKTWILMYLCQHNDVSMLDGLTLLPLANGDFAPFLSCMEPVYLCQENELEMFPSLENRFCSVHLSPDLRKHLYLIACTGKYSLRLLNASDVPVLVKASVQARFGTCQPRVPQDDRWLEILWNYLTSHFPNNLKDFHDVPLLPLPASDGGGLNLYPLNGISVCGTVTGLEPLSQEQGECLQKLGITVFHKLPEYVTKHPAILGQLVLFPSSQGILSALKAVSQMPSCSSVVDGFNSLASEEDRRVLISVLDDCKWTADMKDFLWQLKIFPCTPEDEIVSLAQVSLVAPILIPPVPPQSQMLLCHEYKQRCLAIKLGAREKDIKELCQEILTQMQPTHKLYSRSQIEQFMAFILDNHILLEDRSLLELSRSVQFIKMKSGDVKAAKDVFDPEKLLLKNLFIEEDVFPADDFILLPKLQHLHLKDEYQVTAEDLLNSIHKIETDKGEQAHFKLSQGLWRFLMIHSQNFDEHTYASIASSRCFPCLHENTKPQTYPRNLPLLHQQEVLVRPCEVYAYEHLLLVGSVRPVAGKDMKVESVPLPFPMQPTWEVVLEQLETVINHFNIHDHLQYRSILEHIYQFLQTHVQCKELCSALSQMPCILDEASTSFQKPFMFWVTGSRDDVHLAPYRFQMAKDTSAWQELFLKCGSQIKQDASMLQVVLSEIQLKYQACSFSEAEMDNDLKLVSHILESLKDRPDKNTDEILLPVHSKNGVLLFRLSKECTVSNEDWLIEVSELDSNEVEEKEGKIFVHPAIPMKTALALGALGMIDRALDGTEEIDFDYSQEEPLTTRIHNLLKDSYTDGFSVPKELVQNADDAGATIVKFLLDERLNENCRDHLISNTMSSFQGPALWVWNDATFSDDDFANIIRIGVGSKKGDASKVGKFGLGFNTVYNLTDLPSFISRHSLAIFDPHRKHLRDKPGMKIDFRKPGNRALLKKFPSQFRPFQGVFGCHLYPAHTFEDINYDGTLFRFPFRTDVQADESKIKDESYPSEKRKELLKIFMERAGNLLMFTQNVQKLEIYYLSKTSSSPNDAQLLMSAIRDSTRSAMSRTHQLSIGNESILSFCAHQFKISCQTKCEPPDLSVKEDVVITLEVFPETKAVCNVDSFKSTVVWLISWASGIGSSAEIAKNNIKDCLIPLASVAIPLHLDRRSVLSIQDCPRGFYQQGRLFCFFPLPDNVQQLHLPVHVNGTFALTSSRRGLLTKTDDDLSSVETDWNQALFEDAVTRSHLFLLQNLQGIFAMDSDKQGYFAIWPRSNDKSDFAQTYYRRVVEEPWKLFPHKEEWISFQNARFLDSDFRNSSDGVFVFKSLQHFTLEKGHFVDIPAYIYNAFIELGQESAIQDIILTKFHYFHDVFFPNIQNGYWKGNERIFERDSLILHALKEVELNPLVQTHECIPCSPGGALKKPSDVIHPSGAAAKLFLDEDGCFPQNSGNYSLVINFCDEHILDKLISVGMVKDNLQWKSLIERAESVKRMFKVDKNNAVLRAHILVNYLATMDPSTKTYRFQNYSIENKQELSQLEFLPVCTKPKEWPFPWFGEEDGFHLASPAELGIYKMANLLACTRKLFNSRAPDTFTPTSRDISRVQVLAELGMTTDHCFHHSETISLVLDQLLIVSQAFSKDAPIETKTKTNDVCREIYSFLQKAIQNNKDTTIPALICTKLASKPILWTGHCFAEPTHFAFEVPLECPPYLQPISRNDKDLFRVIFQLFGVKQKFEPCDILQAMTQMKNDIGSQELTENEVELFSRAAQILCSARKNHSPSPINPKTLFLPDSQSNLKSVDCLCLDDCEWIKETPSLSFIHKRFSPEVALSLGVQSKRRSTFRLHTRALPFKQSEKLPKRIKRLLTGYTCDASLFKELIQNADDAGATEIRFIKDFRKLGKTRVPEGWEDLQGPALCVYNNSCFTSKDIEGIQNLGEGSKGDDMVKTGQFGVGFNAVYHVTDVPSFWTRVDGKEEVICVCDPCRFIQNDAWSEPGIMLTDLEAFKQDYTDMMDGYLSMTFDMSKPATMFRLPLRTKLMAKKSAIEAPRMTATDISRILQEFTVEARKCLLFVNNIRKIGIYDVNPKGELQKEFEVKTIVDGNSLNEKRAFLSRLEKEAAKLKDEDLEIDLANISPFEVILHFTIKDNSGEEEEWITVNRAGFANASQVPSVLQTAWRKNQLRLFPRGGVSVRVQRSKDLIKEKVGLYMKVPSKCSHLESTSSYDTQISGSAFCVLPLPLMTGLPVHVNGHFMLEHESRRSLFQRENDDQTEWNKQICTNVIVPAYISALQQLKEIWFKKDQYEHKTSEEMKEKIRCFYSLFPKLQNGDSIFWSSLVSSLYQQIVSRQYALLPVTQNDSLKVTWTVVKKEKCFAGYFIRPLSVDSSKPPGIATTALKSTSNVPQQGPPDENSPEWPVLKSSLAKTLKQINMKLVEAPYHIFDAVRQNGEGKVQVISPRAVIDFLKSVKLDSNDSCNLNDLPQLLEDVDLSESDVSELIHYVNCDAGFSSELAGLPLCLLQSGVLTYFSKDEQPFVSKFNDLLPTFSNKFLHDKLFPIFGPLVGESQNLLRTFSLSECALGLPQVLKESYYKTGQTCHVDVDMDEVPTQKWIERFWEFVQHNVENLTSNDCISSALRCLEDWSLLPVKIMGSDVRYLFPIKERSKVLCIPVVASLPLPPADPIYKVLKKFPIPVLDPCMKDAFAEKLVASIYRPETVADVLLALRDKLVLTNTDAVCICDYFNSNLTKLSSESVLRLKQIPMFVTIHQKVISLLNAHVVIFLPVGIPLTGLDEWSLKTKTILLDPNGFPTNLGTFLKIQTPSDPLIHFWKCLLASLDVLPSEAIPIHIGHIKEYLQKMHDLSVHKKDLVKSLSKTLFIKGMDGKLHEPSYFYSPTNEVFLAMLKPKRFPPAPYNEPDWKDFMKFAGMITEINTDLFVKFAKKISRDGTRLSKEIKEKSKVLVKHLFQRPQLKASGLLNLVKDIRFICPWEMENDQYGKPMSQLCHPFASNRLIAFSESCLQEHWRLIWSTTAILDPDVDPWLRLQAKDIESVKSQLGLKTDVPKNKATEHIENLLQALNTNAQSTECPIRNKTQMDLEWIFIHIYKYLEKSLKPYELNFLKDIPFVYDKKSGRVFSDHQVVITLPSSQAVDGWLIPAPHNFGQFFELFRSLGVASEVQISHYAKILESLYMELKCGESLQHNQIDAAKKSVTGLFQCISSKTESINDIGVKTLYLLDEMNSLRPSCQLIFVDNPQLKERLWKSKGQFHFCIDLESFKIQNSVKQIDRLPDHHRMRLLSKITKENISTASRQASKSGTLSHQYTSRLLSPEFMGGLTRLVNDNFRKSRRIMSDDTVKTLRSSIETIQILEVMGLQTVLFVDEKEMKGTECPRVFFTDGLVVYVNKSAYSETQIEESVYMAIATIIVDIVEEVKFRLLLIKQMLADVDEIEDLLDREKIARYSIFRSSVCAFSSKPGTYFTHGKLCHLDNAFHSFTPGELVILEVSDPVIEIEAQSEDFSKTMMQAYSSIVAAQNESDGSLLGINNLLTCGDDDSYQVFIYGRVLRPVNSNYKESVPLFAREYVTDFGPSHKTFRASDLYKLPSQNEADAPTVQSHSSILENLRHDLVSSWHDLTDKRQRLRVLKRICLLWHPDVNTGSEKFCARVQTLVQEFFASLTSDVEPQSKSGSEHSDASFAPQAESLPPFLECIFQRGCNYADQLRATGESSEAEALDANPQPGEGRRWLCQAVSDFQFASELRDERQTFKSNWICFLCYQSMKHALKALLYHRDADHKVLKTNDDLTLCALADETQHGDLQQLAKRVQDIVGTPSRMTDPLLFSAPHLPAEFYTLNHVNQIYDLTSQVFLKLAPLMVIEKKIRKVEEKAVKSLMVMERKISKGEEKVVKSLEIVERKGEEMAEEPLMVMDRKIRKGEEKAGKPLMVVKRTSRKGEEKAGEPLMVIERTRRKGEEKNGEPLKVVENKTKQGEDKAGESLMMTWRKRGKAKKRQNKH